MEWIVRLTFFDIAIHLRAHLPEHEACFFLHRKPNKVGTLTGDWTLNKMATVLSTREQGTRVVFKVKSIFKCLETS